MRKTLVSSPGQPLTEEDRCPRKFSSTSPAENRMAEPARHYRSGAHRPYDGSKPGPGPLAWRVGRVRPQHLTAAAVALALVTAGGVYAIGQAGLQAEPPPAAAEPSAAAVTSPLTAPPTSAAAAGSAAPTASA